MRRFLGLLMLVLVLAAGAAIGVLGRSWLDGQQSHEQATSEPTSGAPTAPPPPAAAAPTSPSGSRDLVVEVTESELQSQMNAMLVGQSLGTTPLGDATIESVRVALRDRQVKVDGAARTGFLNAPFTAAGTVAPDGNGRPRVQVNEATVGGVLLPDPARAALADSLQTQVDGLFANRAIKVRTIDIADGKMRVVGTVGNS